MNVLLILRTGRELTFTADRHEADDSGFLVFERDGWYLRVRLADVSLWSVNAAADA